MVDATGRETAGGMQSVSDDSYSAERQRMVREQLAARDITDPRVLDVMRAVPRHRFVPPAWVAQAYADRALALERGQTISQPYIVALMTQSLQVTPEHCVLEVGTGSGYQTAILARLARRVCTIERIDTLSTTARTTIGRPWTRTITFRVGDGTQGWPEAAPFDRIIVTAGAPAVPDVLVEQLVAGGRLVIPVGPGDRQTLMLVQRHDDRIEEQELVPCRFIKLIGRAGWPTPAEEA